MSRRLQGSGARERAAAPWSLRGAAWPWMAMSVLAIVLGTGLAAAWTASGPAGDRGAPSESARSDQGLGEGLLEAVRALLGMGPSAAPVASGGLGTPLDNQPEQLAADHSPEGRLIRAYQALQDGQVETARQTVSKLVRDHPEFSLAQLLHGDLLTSQSGRTQVFGVPANTDPDPTDRRAALRDEAVRRWTALQSRPPPGHVPAEFVRLAPEVRHAVAIDASRSRLYLFEHGPQGLSLKQDIYVSVGKRGVGKQAGGDQRTPLGVYWITATFKSPMRDPRLGEAALGINYPNVWDRQLGRTGSGLFLHGVPPETLAHPPQATDGCVAMSNDEALGLLATLDPDTTPVVISRSLTWVPAAQAAAAHGEFLAAHAAWLNARRSGDEAGLRAWYDRGAAPLPGQPESQASSPSIIAWHGDETPVVIVNSAHPALDEGQAAHWRQYWVRRDGQWRIFFDNAVPRQRNPAMLARPGAPASALPG